MKRFLTRLKNYYNKTQPEGEGQGLVEYAIIIAVAGLAVIAVVNLFEPQIGNVFSRLSRDVPVAPPELLNYTPVPTATQDPNATPTWTPLPSETPTETATPEPSPTPTALAVKINFQPELAERPSGYFADGGSTYAINGVHTYGWNEDFTNRAAHRDDVADQRYDTLVHTWNGGIEGSWEFEVANGNYTVFVAAGDPEVLNDEKTQKVLVEGIPVIDTYIVDPDLSGQGTVTVTVSDGRLTVKRFQTASYSNTYHPQPSDATKLNFIHIDTFYNDLPGAPTAGNINFQPEAYVEPSGYLKDYGLVYGARANGYTFGWDTDTTGRMRDRNNSDSPDQRYDSINHMFTGGASHTWSVEVPNGTYHVCVGAGDPNTPAGKTYTISLEGNVGTPVVNFVTSATEKWQVVSQDIVVADGRIDVRDESGESKIMFIEYTANTASPGTTCSS